LIEKPAQAGSALGRNYALARTSTLKTVKIYPITLSKGAEIKTGTKKLVPGEFAIVNIFSTTAWKLEGK